MKTRVAILFWSSLLLAAPVWSQNFSYFPVAADGVGPNGSLRTSIFLSNPGISVAKVAIVWTNDDGSARQVTLSDLGRDSKFAITLAPGASRILETDGSGVNLSGAAVIGCDQIIGVWGIISAFDRAGVLLGETGFAAAAISPGFRVPVDSTSGLNTGIALYNPGPGDASIKASLVDQSGASAGSAVVTLAAGARVIRFVSGDWFAGLGDFRGTMNLTSTIPLSAQIVRQSSTSPVAAVLEAPPTISSRMRFYFPRLADGASDTATLSTTFLVTNLSSKPAAVTLTMTNDDGSPWLVNLPGQTTIAPGASVFWRTDGTGDYTTGAATIQSDRPLGVQALVTASDAQGATISETAAADAKMRQQLTLPFDSSTDPMSGAAFYNTGTRAVTITLTLRDANGKIAASTQLAAVAAGGRIAGAIADFFPGTSILRGTLSADTGGFSEPFVSAVAIRQNQSLPWSSTLPAGAIPLTGVPITVTSSIDAKRAVTADIGPTGGSLSLTDTAGNRFTLTIPPNALFGTETIVMTPVTAAAGIPGSGLVAVQLAPDGLALLTPGTLVIQPAAPASPGTLMPVGWYGSGAGVYLTPQLPKASQTTLLLTHFSYEGINYFKPGDLTSVLLHIIDTQAYYQSEANAVANAYRMASLLGEAGEEREPQEFYDLQVAEYAEAIEPLMEIALASQDENVIRCALNQAFNYKRKIELLGGIIDPDDAISSAVSEFQYTAIQIQYNLAEKRCKQEHDITALEDILAIQRQAVLFGLSLSSSSVADLQQSCPQKLQLDFTSSFSTVFTPGGNFKGQISAKFALNGTFDKEVLTQVTNPAQDLLASYLLNGQATEVYDSVSWAPEGADGCVVTTKGTAGLMTVLDQAGKNKSQVQYMFTAGYDPAPFSISQIQLCSYCPVYLKKPVKVELLVNPGKPLEANNIACPGAHSIDLTLLLWSISWNTVHPPDITGYTFFNNWEFPANHDPFAQKKSLNDLHSNAVSIFENTTLKLTPATPPSGQPQE